MNYQALGEHTAYQTQALQAARKRCAALTALDLMLSQATQHPERPLNLGFMRDMVDVAEAAQTEMNAAVARANEAAALCGKAPIVLPSSWAACLTDAAWH